MGRRARAADDPTLRVVVLAGAGKVFCAGADVDVDVEDGRATRDEENLRDATAMSRDVRARSTRCRCR